MDGAVLKIQNSCPFCKSRSLSKSPAILMPLLAKRIFGWEVTKIDDSWGLKSIPNGNAYVLCSSVYCKKYHFLFLDMCFNEMELFKYYCGYRDEIYNTQRCTYKPSYKNLIERLKHKCPHHEDTEQYLRLKLRRFKYILDVGGGNGTNTPFIGSSNIDIIEVQNGYKKNKLVNYIGLVTR